MVGPPTNPPPGDKRPIVLGRYALFDEIAAGGMATVHLGRLVGEVGFSRIVAIKRLHPQYASDPEFVSMFLDEARLVSRIQHPNVVQTLDIVTMDEELFVVMEYVAGESLHRLLQSSFAGGDRVPERHVASIMSGVLHGLHAAHEAKSERRKPLNIVHRDVSPHNVLVGTDGVARVLDFGVAKAALRAQSTRDGQMKGKMSYMSPEQLNGEETDRRADVFAAGVMLWEGLCGRRLFAGNDAGEIFAKVLTNEIPSPRGVVPELSERVERVVMKSLERDIDARYQTAREFAIDLEEAITLSTSRAVGDWVEHEGGDALVARAALVGRVEKFEMDPETIRRPRSSLPPPIEEPELEPSFSGLRLRNAATEAVARPSVPSSAPLIRASDTRRLAVLALVASAAGGTLAFALFRPAQAPDAPPSASAPVDPGEPAAATDRAGQSAPVHPARGPTFDISDLPAAPPDAGARRRAPPRSAPAGNEKSCDPPWITDKDGIRRVKPECL